MSRILQKISTFARLSHRRKGLFMFAFLLSFYSFVRLRFFRKHARFKNGPAGVNQVNTTIAGDIRWAISTVSNYVFWENVCRHQAFQAWWLCRYYHQPCRVYIGFRKDQLTGITEGHAWTMLGNEMITGFCRPEDFVVMNVFE